MAKTVNRKDPSSENMRVLRRLLGSDLAEIRQRCNLTQKQLAARLACSRCFVSQMEHGSALPGAPMLVRMLDALRGPDSPVA